ncbi:MAG: hypothetical protein GXO63_01240 [Candidatus Micrarchaeota archaeon]|nr:hypothetical protein [Candidatus Micrarchaeota archaeon]
MKININNLKGFLKPDLKKIVVFVLIIIMANFPPLGGFPEMVHHYGPPQPPELEYKSNPIFWFIDVYYFKYIPFIIDPFLRAHDYAMAKTLLFVIWIYPLYWYLISCLIVFGYEKLKNKNLW